MMRSQSDNSILYTLASRACSGDKLALSELVQATRIRLFAIAYAELRNYEDARDAVASALLQVCLHISELRQPESVLPWMQSIVRNEVRRLQRRASPDAPLTEQQGASSNEANHLTLRLDIERALSRLSASQAQAVRLFYIDSFSIDEISRQLGCSCGTVKSWLSRARRRLATDMEVYRPMIQPRLTAVLIQTDLAPETQERIQQTLQSAGYQSHIRNIRVGRDDLPEIIHSVKDEQLILLDEYIGGRSAFEMLLHLKANPETREIPVGVLCASPSDFTAAAYFAAGVDRLIDKNRSEDIAQIAGSLPGQKRDGHGLSGVRVLVCDDETITRTQIHHGLTHTGMNVVGLAEDGLQAIEIALRERPDMVIMDIHLPGMDGLEATRRILAEYSACVVMLTAYDHLQQEAREAGASGYIVKPVTSDSFLLQLQEAWMKYLES